MLIHSIGLFSETYYQIFQLVFCKLNRLCFGGVVFGDMNLRVLFARGYFDINTESKSRCFGNYWGCAFQLTFSVCCHFASGDFIYSHMVAFGFLKPRALGPFSLAKLRHVSFRENRCDIASRWTSFAIVSLTLVAELKKILELPHYYHSTSLHLVFIRPFVAQLFSSCSTQAEKHRSLRGWGLL